MHTLGISEEKFSSGWRSSNANSVPFVHYIIPHLQEKAKPYFTVIVKNCSNVATAAG